MTDFHLKPRLDGAGGAWLRHLLWLCARSARPCQQLRPRCRYAGRSDAGCLYELCVRLLSQNEAVLAEYRSETIAIPQDNDASWTEVSCSGGLSWWHPTCMNWDCFQARRSRL